MQVPKLRVPKSRVPQQRVSKKRVPKKRRPAPRSDDFDDWDLDDDDWNTPALPRRPTRQARSPQKKRRKKRSGGGAGLQISLFMWGLIGVFGLSVIVCIGATIDNNLGMIGATAMIVLALAMLLVGHIWGICVAFSESAICGILYWWLPFFAFYYLITRWDEMKKPFSVGVLGYILIIAAVLVGAIPGVGM